MTRAAAVAPILAHLRAFDRLRVELERGGGEAADLEALTSMLSKEMRLRGPWRDYVVSLREPASLQDAMWNAAHLHAQVRRLPSGLPAYYVAELRRDYWGQYPMIVRDWYRSPGYPLVDRRFVSLMDRGRETIFLRLSQFRSGASRLGGLASSGSAGPGCERGVAQRPVEEILHAVGRLVFSAAWHEDQRVAVRVADCIPGLDGFRHALELLHLVLTGDLAALRHTRESWIPAFFSDVYPQPAIRRLVTLLPSTGGAEASALASEALRLYRRLSRAFGVLLRSEVPWDGATVALYEACLANFDRPDLLRSRLAGADVVRAAASKLSDRADRVVDTLLPPEPRDRGQMDSPTLHTA